MKDVTLCLDSFCFTACGSKLFLLTFIVRLSSSIVLPLPLCLDRIYGCLFPQAFRSVSLVCLSALSQNHSLDSYSFIVSLEVDSVSPPSLFFSIVLAFPGTLFLCVKIRIRLFVSVRPFLEFGSTAKSIPGW